MPRSGRSLEVRKMNDFNTYKAWVNVNTKMFENVSSAKMHYDYAKEHPEKFGLVNLGLIIKDGELIEVTEKIDEKKILDDAGWVAISTKKIDGKLEAHVSALTIKNVLTATRLLYKKRQKYGAWDFLKVNSDAGNFVFKGKAKIEEYILGK